MATYQRRGLVTVRLPVVVDGWVGAGGKGWQEMVSCRCHAGMLAEEGWQDSSTGGGCKGLNYYYYYS